MVNARGRVRSVSGDARSVWRDLCATRSASLLAVLSVALPLAVLSTTDVLARTARVSHGQLLVRALGHADAVVTDLGAHPITQRPDGRGFHSEPASAPTTPPRPSDVRDPSPIRALLPRTARLTGDATARVSVRLDAVTMPITAWELDYRVAAAAGLVVPRSGRMPAGPGEVDISTALREQTSASVGDTLVVPRTGASLRVVGVADDPNDLASVFALGLPGTLLPASATDGLVHQSWLVTGVGELDWPAVRRLNGHGLLVVSRAVLRDAPPVNEVPYCQSAPCSPDDAVQATSDETAGFRLPGTRVPLWVALPVLLVLVGIGFGGALIACARRTRQAELWGLADLEAPSHRHALLAAGAIGVAGALVGLPAGVGLAEALRPVLRPLLVRDLGPLNTHPLGLLVIAGFGVLVAVVPAGRRGREHGRRSREGQSHRVPAMRGGRLLREDGGHE